MSDDIREWARNQGMDVGASGPIPKRVKEAYQGRGETAEPEAFPGDVQSDPDPDTDIVEEEKPKRTREVAPKQPSLGDRVKESLDAGRGRAKRARAAKAKVTKPKGPRVAIDTLLTGIYTGAAGIVGKVNPPVGYIMGIQSPVAGMLLEDSVKGTIVDHLLQPIAKNADRARTARALIGPPIIVALIQAQPDKAPLLIPMLRKMLADYIDLAGPKVVEIAKREAEFEDKYGKDLDEIINGLVNVINITNMQAQAMQEQAAQGE